MVKKLILFVIFLTGCTASDWQAIQKALEETQRIVDRRLQEYYQSYPPYSYQPQPNQYYYPQPQPSYQPQPDYQPQPSYSEQLSEIFKKVAKAIEPTHPTVRTFALKLARKYPGEYNVGQICIIFKYLEENWRYVSDPKGVDYVAPAHESIEAGLAGDCDDFAVLMASLIEAIGGSARVIVAWGPEGGHAYCEVYVGSEKDLEELIDWICEYSDEYGTLSQKIYRWLVGQNYVFHYHKTASGEVWLNLDWSAEYPGGPFFKSYKAYAVYPDGKVKKLK